ncbi:hypothetical protein AMS68_006315 [Peltaster fructicola]|uniref:U6 small nuclear RNA (adenine-(43)-N(6))-methyltransferase n=1 Tax=Peltaster fructicola TaxID=286661 RepID=A0A6H0Y1S1_9PEZI|nr:hypothetical protein AMS68_006315 [Peltaster fructicola]
MATASGKRLREDYYDEDVNFQELAKEHPEFGQLFASSGEHLDWQDPATIQLLTKALLKKDFDLEITLPSDRLCPPVPVRWNYIRWIQELLDTTNESYIDGCNGKIIGLDIGTGASCIYALLACASRPQCTMLATDIDAHSFEFAQKNVDGNHLSDRITLKQNTPDDKLIPPAEDMEHIDFVVCNPPFYDSQEDMDNAYKNKALPASAVCTGSTNEMICVGGDLGFATRILEESLKLRQRVKWYSCMFSRKASAENFVAKLKKHGINNFAAANLRAGQKTVRWAIGWSFSGLRPRNDVVRSGQLSLGILPLATDCTIDVHGTSAHELSTKLNDVLSDMDLQWMHRPETYSGTVVTTANVWSRSARRKRKREGESVAPADDAKQNIALAMTLTCNNASIHARWLHGNDHVLLESFVAMLRNKLGVRNYDN